MATALKKSIFRIETPRDRAYVIISLTTASVPLSFPVWGSRERGVLVVCLRRDSQDWNYLDAPICTPLKGTIRGGGERGSRRERGWIERHSRRRAPLH